MSTPDDQAPLGEAPDDASSETGEARADAGAPRAEGAGSDDGGAAKSAESAPVELSPAVRRLVRQFDLDITGIHGTGPSGRIRVGDVINLLGGRTDSGNRIVPVRAAAAEGDGAPQSDTEGGEAVATDRASQSGEGLIDHASLPTSLQRLDRAAIPTSSVFECDVGRVLAHRKKTRDDGTELLTTSYFLTALAAALDTAPEITAGHPPRFGVSLATPEGELRHALLDVASLPQDAGLDEQVRAVDAALRENLDAAVATANLLVHHYGESGSVLATPTPIGADHAASVGIGVVRREVVVRSINGAETPRLAACCYLSLSFFAERVPLHRANRALAIAVRMLEEWPE